MRPSSTIIIIIIIIVFLHAFVQALRGLSLSSFLVAKSRMAGAFTEISLEGQTVLLRTRLMT